jgi:hypothetical protein
MTGSNRVDDLPHTLFPFLYGSAAAATGEQGTYWDNLDLIYKLFRLFIALPQSRVNWQFGVSWISTHQGVIKGRRQPPGITI